MNHTNMNNANEDDLKKQLEDFSRESKKFSHISDGVNTMLSREISIKVNINMNLFVLK